MEFPVGSMIEYKTSRGGDRIFIGRVICVSAERYKVEHTDGRDNSVNKSTTYLKLTTGEMTKSPRAPAAEEVEPSGTRRLRMPISEEARHKFDTKMCARGEELHEMSNMQAELQVLLDDFGLDINGAIDLLQVKQDEKMKAVAEGKPKRIIDNIEEEINLLKPAIDLWCIISNGGIASSDIDQKISAFFDLSSQIKELMATEDFMKDEHPDIDAVLSRLADAKAQVATLRPGVIYNNRMKTIKLCEELYSSLSNLADSARNVERDLTTYTFDSCGETGLDKLRLLRQINAKKISKKKELDPLARTETLESENSVLDSILSKWESYYMILDGFPNLLERFPEVSSAIVEDSEQRHVVEDTKAGGEADVEVTEQRHVRVVTTRGLRALQKPGGKRGESPSARIQKSVTTERPEAFSNFHHLPPPQKIKSSLPKLNDFMIPSVMLHIKT